MKCAHANLFVCHAEPLICAWHRTSPKERAYSLKKSLNLTKPLEFVCNMFYGCF